MSKCFILILLIAVATLGLVWAKKGLVPFPKYIKVCRRHDAQLNACLNNTLSSLREQMGRGISELYVPALEPLVIPELKFNQKSGAIYLKANYKNVHLHGLTNFRVMALNLDAAKLSLNVTVEVPLVEMEANYEMHGKIMMLPLLGHGACKANFTNVVATLSIDGQLVKKAGHSHVKLTKLALSYKMENTTLDFENLVNGDPTLSHTMNEFLNSNWQELSEEMRPLLENAMLDIVKSTFVRVFDTYTYDELLPI